MNIKKSCYFLVSFTALFFVTLTTCALLSISLLLVNPISRSFHRKISTFFIYAWFLNVPLVLHKWSNVKLIVHGKKTDFTKSALYLVNHLGNVDWLIFICWISGFGFPYPGCFKAIAKNELSRVPVFGWFMTLCEFIFLTRNWAEDKAYITKKLLDLSTFSDTGHPLGILIFPEGTRLTPEKLKNSQDFARSKGLHVFSKLLYPRFKGFLGFMPLMRSHIHYLVDCTLIYNQGIPSIADVLQGNANQTVHLHVRDFPISQVPQQPDDLKEWLRVKWIEKEEIIKRYEENQELRRTGESMCERSPSYLACYILHVFTATLCYFSIRTASQYNNGTAFLLASISAFFFICIYIAKKSLSNSKVGISSPK